MIPKWQEALLSAQTLLSSFGRVIISDFDTYTEEGNTVKDWMINKWYKQDGVRIEAETRTTVAELFPKDKFLVTFCRYQEKLFKVNIPHQIICCRKGTFTNTKGFRRPSERDLYALNLKEEDDDYSCTKAEEKKSD